MQAARSLAFRWKALLCERSRLIAFRSGVECLHNHASNTSRAQSLRHALPVRCCQFRDLRELSKGPRRPPLIIMVAGLASTFLQMDIGA